MVDNLSEPIHPHFLFSTLQDMEAGAMLKMMKVLMGKRRQAAQKVRTISSFIDNCRFDVPDNTISGICCFTHEGYLTTEKYTLILTHCFPHSRQRNGRRK
jgi:hypothetical protein